MSKKGRSKLDWILWWIGMGEEFKTYAKRKKNIIPIKAFTLEKKKFE